MDMSATKTLHQHVRNYLLRAKLAAAYENGDANTLQKISREFDQQQLLAIRKTKAVHRAAK